MKIKVFFKYRLILYISFAKPEGNASITGPKFEVLPFIIKQNK